MTTPGEHGERELAEGQRRGRVPADTLSVRLMLARKLAGVSIREAADLCGLGRGAWTKWENGARPLDLLEITGIIAERLDIDVDWLRFGGPLAGPKGREVRSLTKRSMNDTLRYSTSSVRPMSTRPRAGRPNGRGDATAPALGRPVVIDHSTSSSAARPTNAV
jgi:transcriptional regulator with XRE-family HTH domain